MRISEWSSDVCSSDLGHAIDTRPFHFHGAHAGRFGKAQQVLHACIDAVPVYQYFLNARSMLAQTAQYGVESKQNTGVAHFFLLPLLALRSEALRVGKEWFSTWRSRGSG